MANQSHWLLVTVLGRMEKMTHEESRRVEEVRVLSPNGPREVEF